MLRLVSFLWMSTDTQPTLFAVPDVYYFEQVLVQSILDRVRPESPATAILRGGGERFRMPSWAECWVDNGPRSVVVLSITSRLSGETGPQGSRVQFVSVRSEYVSSPSRTMVVFCVFPRDGLCPISVSEVQGARGCRGWGWTAMYRLQGAKYTSCTPPPLDRLVRSSLH